MNNKYSIIPKVLKHHFSLAVEVMNSLIQINKVSLWDYHNANCKSYSLPLVTFMITPLCNLKCVMCGQKGTTGTLLPKKAAEEAKTIVPLERYKALADEVAGKVKAFYVWGGEPFLYPDFMELAAYWARKLPIFAVNTNGVTLKEHARRIVEDQWKGIYISLDGLEIDNDAIRGLGTYKKVIDGIRALNEEKRKKKSLLPYLGIVSTITRLNYENLYAFEQELSQLNLSWHIINLGTYTNEEIGKKHKECIKTNFNFIPKQWQGFINGYYDGIDYSNLAQILKNIHNLKVSYPIITVPDIPPEKIKTYYTELQTPVRKNCTTPWYAVDINYNGDVGFCPAYHEFSIGNIKKNSLFDIYNSEAAIHFRNKLRESAEGIFPACSRCYQLMLCGKKIKGF